MKPSRIKGNRDAAKQLSRREHLPRTYFNRQRRRLESLNTSVITHATNRTRNGLQTWTSSYWFVALLALTIGALAVATSFGFDWIMHGVIRPVYASDLLEGAVAAIFSGAALHQLQARRRELQVRMQIVEDVNHHVRNALTSVVLSSSLRDDKELDALIKDACNRVDWVLNDVLPQSIKATDLQAQHPNWSSGRQLETTRLRADPKDRGGQR